MQIYLRQDGFRRPFLFRSIFDLSMHIMHLFLEISHNSCMIYEQESEKAFI